MITKDTTTGWRTWWYEVSEPAFPPVITREGQEVAAVAADDAETAERALALIEVGYEVLPPMIEADATLASPPPQVVEGEEYPGRERFDRKPFVIRRGDTAKGFAEADVILEDTYVTPTQYHATIQTRACVASWDGESLTVWDSAQGVWNSKLAFAKSFGLDPDRVRVIVENIGGGFGSKAWSHRLSYYAAKLSMATGSRCGWSSPGPRSSWSTRTATTAGSGSRYGVRRDGTITAIEEHALLNIGAAAGGSNYNANRIIWQTSNLYECPNVLLEQIGVFTNRQLTGPTRAPFNMPAIFPLEMHIDRLAAAIGMDPLEIRRRTTRPTPPPTRSPS